jgi:hypothetical protein
MHKQGDFLDKCNFPTSEFWFDILIDPTISLFSNALFSNAPTGNGHNFSKPWALESLFG